MPLFDMSCRKCGKTSELLVRGNQSPTCPHCQSLELDKLPAGPAFVLRGGGWAADLYGSSNAGSPTSKKSVD